MKLLGRIGTAAAAASLALGVVSTSDAYAATKPSAPASVAASLAGTTATIAWAPPASTGGATISGYLASRDGTDAKGVGAWSTTDGATVRSQSFINLKPGSTYHLSVAAKNSAGTGAAVSKTVLVPGLPAATFSVSGTTATVKWSAPTVGTTGLTGYRVARDGTDSKGVGPWSITDSATTRVQTLTNLAPGTTYHLTVAAVNGSGVGPAVTGAVTVPRPALHWTGPTTVEANQGHPDSVSCPTATFCVAVDETGHAVTYNGSTWTAPAAVVVGTGPTSVSCSSASFCLAVDGHGAAYRFDGTTWSAPVNVGIPATAVSCASPTFCVAVGGVSAAIYRGTSWANGVAIDPGQVLTSVSCPTTTFCAALDSSGAFTFTGSAWSARSSIADAVVLQSVSCRSATYCLAVGGDYEDGSDGSVSQFDGTTWSDAAEVTESGAAFRSVSCPVASTTCFAVNYQGGVLTYTDSLWSNETSVDAGNYGTLYYEGYIAVSCASGSSCAVVGTDGRAVTYNGSVWTARKVVDQSQADPTVACASATFCASLDFYGNGQAFNGTTWSKPVKVDAGLPDDSFVRETTGTFVSCAPGTRFCAAADLRGFALTYSGSAWSTPVSIDGNYITGISCTAATFCLALDDSGQQSTFNGSTWSPAVSTGAASPESGLSCVSPTFCVSNDFTGVVDVYNGTTWTSTDQTRPVTSCASATFCLGILNTGSSSNSAVFNGKTWSASTTVEAGTIRAVACASSTNCLAVDQQGRYLRWTGAAWTAPSAIDPAAPPQSVLAGTQCVSPSFCFAVDGTSAMYSLH